VLGERCSLLAIERDALTQLHGGVMV
jgi:hypothetical protein